MKRHFERVIRASNDARQLRKDLTPQGFYDENNMVKIFCPGEFISMHDIKKFKIPNHFFVHPDSMRIRGAFDTALRKKGKFSVGIIRTARGMGDIIMSTVIARALKYKYGNKVQIWYAVRPEYEGLLENNRCVDKIFTSQEDLMKAVPDVHYNINGLEMRTEIKDFEKEEGITKNRTSIYLEQTGLFIENKTPIYEPTGKEKEWAEKHLKRLGFGKDKKIVGVQLEASDISKTYPYIDKVVELLNSKYHILYLDKKDSSGKHIYNLRQIGALISKIDLVITPDSFFYHLAGALKKRGVVTFGYVNGNVWTEDYEKITPVEIDCPFGFDKCWWELKCFEGKSYQEKRHVGTPRCVSEIPPEMIVEEVEKHFSELKKILIVVLTYNLLSLTKKTIDSIRSIHNYEILVVDNESSDGTIEWLKRNKIKYISKKSSVAQALNVGLRKAYDGNYDYVLLCNNDVILESDYIDKVVEVAERRKSYAVQGRIINKGDKSLQIPVALQSAEAPMMQTIAGSFSAILLSRDCLKNIGKFNEEYWPRYQEDDDYLLRIRLANKDYISIYSTSFLHLLGQVIKTNKEEEINHMTDWNRNVQRFKKRWGFDLYKERELFVNLDEVKRRCLDWKSKILIPIGHKSEEINMKRYDTPREIIETIIKEKKRAKVLVARKVLAGAGDIIFLSIVGKILKKHYKNSVIVDYATTKRFMSLLMHYPYIDNVINYDEKWGEYDYIMDTGDYEHRTELNQIEKHGKIIASRTKIHLHYLGFREDKDLHPDYFVTKEEKEWAEKEWNATRNKRVAMNFEGSNIIKAWWGMSQLFGELKEDGFCVIRLDKKVGDKYQYNFRQIGALISTAKLTISPDTGASNIAGALNVPVITVFSNRNGKNFEEMFSSMIAIQGDCPKLDENYCDLKVPCIPGKLRDFRKKEQHRTVACFQRLSVETVYKKVKEVLK